MKTQMERNVSLKKTVSTAITSRLPTGILQQKMLRTLCLFATVVVVASAAFDEEEGASQTAKLVVKTLDLLAAIVSACAAALASDSPSQKAFFATIAFFLGSVLGPFALVFGTVYCCAKLCRCCRP